MWWEVLRHNVYLSKFICFSCRSALSADFSALLVVPPFLHSHSTLSPPHQHRFFPEPAFAVRSLPCHCISTSRPSAMPGASVTASDGILAFSTWDSELWWNSISMAFPQLFSRPVTSFSQKCWAIPDALCPFMPSLLEGFSTAVIQGKHLLWFWWVLDELSHHLLQKAFASFSMRGHDSLLCACNSSAVLLN